MKLVYIGDKEDVITYLQSATEVDLHHFNSMGEFVDGASALKDAAVVYYEYQPQTRSNAIEEVFPLIKKLMGRPRLPIVLLMEAGARPNPTLLKHGVLDAYARPFNNEILTERVEFLNTLLAWKKKEEPVALAGHSISRSKRTFDIVFASFVLILISPILLLVALAIRLESKGPIIYRSKRVGTGYEVFDFLKFRSMYPDADKRLKELEHLNQYAEERKTDEVELKTSDIADEIDPGIPLLITSDGRAVQEEEYLNWKATQQGSSFIKIANDPRITKVGKFIRNTSIDELPQLINVLKGDMSIVGNRPLPLYEAESLTSDDWAERFMAPAGITGLWQVEKRGTSEMSDEERKQLDNTYAQKHSLAFDIKIILKTIPALLQKENV